MHHSKGDRLARRAGTALAGALLLALAAGTVAAAESEPPAAPSTALDKPAQGVPPPPAAAPADPRPVVLLTAKNAFKPEDKVFAQVLEGRLIADLGDMETFRTVGHGSDSDYALLVTIRNIQVTQGQTSGFSRDAESSGGNQSTDQVTLGIDLDLLLSDKQGAEVYKGKLSASASRQLEISIQHTTELLNQEMIDRAAQKLERIVRKKLPKPKS